MGQVPAQGMGRVALSAREFSGAGRNQAWRGAGGVWCNGKNRHRPARFGVLPLPPLCWVALGKTPIPMPQISHQGNGEPPSRALWSVLQKNWGWAWMNGARAAPGQQGYGSVASPQPCELLTLTWAPSMAQEGIIILIQVAG